MEGVGGKDEDDGDGENKDEDDGEDNDDDDDMRALCCWERDGTMKPTRSNRVPIPMAMVDAINSLQ